MVQFTTTLLKFEEHGDKSGWTYIEVPAELAQQLKPDNKKAFRVKGFLDEFAFSGTSLLPTGEGHFMMAINATMRKAIRKHKGASIHVKLYIDHQTIEPPPELVACLEDEPYALTAFNKLNRSHQHYFIRWILEAKTEPTKTKRLTQTISALCNGLDFVQMIRMLKEQKVE
jgi:hypothetical protein